MASVRAAGWFNQLVRLGFHLPLFVVRDLGLMLTTRPGVTGWTLQPDDLPGAVNTGANGQELLAYRELLGKVAQSEVVAKASTLRLRDEVIAVLLLRSLGDIYHRWREPTKAVAVSELSLEPGQYEDAPVAELFEKFDRGPLWGFLQHLNKNGLHFLTCLELIDMETVRLLGLFRNDSMQSPDMLGNSIDLVDLVSAFHTPALS